MLKFQTPTEHSAHDIVSQVVKFKQTTHIQTIIYEKTIDFSVINDACSKHNIVGTIQIAQT